MNKVFIFLMILSVFILNSCKNDTGITDIKVNEKSDIERALLNLESMGFNTDDYVHSEDIIIVEGDIVFEISTLLQTDSRQYRSSRLVEQRYQTYITIRMLKNLPTTADQARWDWVLRESVEEWNSVNSNLQYYIVNASDSNADITVSYDPAFFDRNNAGGALAASSFPMDLKPFGKIWINDQSINVNYFMKTKILMHEMGHSIGLGHQNKVDGGTTLISGTPTAGNDRYSIMAQGNLDYWTNYGKWPEFTYYDKIAINNIYPKASIRYQVRGSFSGWSRWYNEGETASAGGRRIQDIRFDLINMPDSLISTRDFGSRINIYLSSNSGYRLNIPELRRAKSINLKLIRTNF